MKFRYLLLAALIPFLCACTGGNEQRIYHSAADVSHGTVGVLLGSSQDKFVTENYPEAEVLRVDMSTDLAMALKAGTCDAALFGADEAQALLKEYPKFGVLENNLCMSELGIGFRQEDSPLRKMFNAFLTQLKEDGTYDEMLKRWLTVPGTGTMPSIPLPTTGTPLRIGTTGIAVPYSYRKDGKFVGLDMELMYRFAAQIGRPIKVEVMNFGGLIPALISGKLDVIANYIMITPERAKEVAFSDSYYSLGSTLLTLREHLAEEKAPSSISDMRGKRVAVLLGSTCEHFMAKQHPEVELLRMDNTPDALQSLKQGHSEGFLETGPHYKEIAKTDSSLICSDSLFTEKIAIGFSKERTALRDEFNAFLKDIRANGEYDEIYNRWTVQGDDSPMPDIDLPQTGSPFKVGVIIGSSPFVFIRDGHYCGMEIELVMRFAKKKGHPVEFSNLSFGSLIPALVSGKIDMIAACLAITEERSKNVAFADSHYSLPIVLVTQTNKNMVSGFTGNGKGLVAGVKGFIHSIKDSFRNNLIAEHRYLLILDGLKVTILISALSALLGTLFGAGICYLRMNRRRSLRWIGHTYITLMRGTPVLVFLMLMYYVVFARWDISATTVAILAFAMNFAAYVSEMFRSSIRGIDRGQTEAGIALGFTPVQTFIHIVMPQAVNNVLPIYKGELISLVKMTSIVGYIAVEDLTKASDIIRSRTFDAFFPLIMVAVIYFLLAWLFATLLDCLNCKRKIN